MSDAESSSSDGEYAANIDLFDLLDECPCTSEGTKFSPMQNEFLLHPTITNTANKSIAEPVNSAREHEDQTVDRQSDDEDEQRSELTLEIFAYAKGQTQASTLRQSAPVALSTCHEASSRFMLQLDFHKHSHLSGRIVDRDGMPLCETTRIPLMDDGAGETWIPLSVSDNALRMCTVECAGGWTICFDVKDACSETSGDRSAVLRTVHVMHSSPEEQEEPGSRQEVNARDSDQPHTHQRDTTYFDCDDVTAVEVATNQARENLKKAQKSQALGFGLDYRKPKEQGVETDMRSEGLQILERILGVSGQLPAFLLDERLWRSISGGLKSLTVGGEGWSRVGEALSVAEENVAQLREVPKSVLA